MSRSAASPLLSRRSLLRIGGAAGLLAAASPLLAACGGGGGGQAPAPTTGTGGVDTDQLRSLLGVQGSAAEGVSVSMGAVLALTGPGAFYGATMSKGINLAVAQIRAAGGPQISVDFQDHESGSAQAGANAARQLGSNRTPVCLASYVGALGSMFPAIEQYRMLTLDGGGGTSNFGQGKPYFWGLKAVEPDDYFAGVVAYWKATAPQVRRVSLVAIDQGQVNDIVLANFTTALTGGGFEVASTEFTPIGTTDFTSTLGALRAAAPDAVFLFLVGNDAGYFMKGYRAAGLQPPVVGAEYTPDAREAAAGAFDSYAFSTDWFDAANPTNPLAKLFVDSYVAEYSERPDYYAANYWEDTMAVWDLVRRVGGGEVTGPALQDALVAAPTFRSVYGGSATEVGELTLDPDTHSVVSRPLGVYTCSGDTVTQVASFGIGGADFRLVTG